jgi:RNA polymerase primary sigma factor
MDAPFVQGEENRLLNVMQDERQATPDADLLHDSLRQEVQRARSTLTRREADVITPHFGLSGHAALTLEEIGEQFSLTRERVHTSRSQSLKSYLG